jgi:hypothetical protein
MYFLGLSEVKHARILMINVECIRKINFPTRRNTMQAACKIRIKSFWFNVNESRNYTEMESCSSFTCHLCKSDNCNANLDYTGQLKTHRPSASRFLLAVCKLSINKIINYESNYRASVTHLLNSVVLLFFTIGGISSFGCSGRICCRGMRCWCTCRSVHGFDPLGQV